MPVGLTNLRKAKGWLAASIIVIASTMPAVPDATMAIWIQRPRPMRIATSLPRMEEGTAPRFTAAAMAARFHGNSPPVACRPAE